MEKLLLLSRMRIEEIAKGAPPIVGEVERLAMTALHYMSETASAVNAFQDAGRELLKLQDQLGQIETAVIEFKRVEGE